MIIKYEISEKQMDLEDVVHIWRIISKFKKKDIKFVLFLKQNPNHYYMTMLLNKIDWMIEKQNYKIDLKVVMSIQYTDSDDYMYDHYGPKYYEFFKGLFFTNQRFSEKEFEALMYWPKQSEFRYGIVNFKEDCDELEKSLPKIWVFENTQIDYYQNWFKEIKQKFLDGEELYYEYRS